MQRPAHPDAESPKPGGSKITGILLAAGQSRRFGKHKLLVEIGDRPLIYYSLKSCIDSTLSSVLLVLGTQSVKIEEAVAQFFIETGKINIIVNDECERGMMSSLKMGIRSLDADCRGVMVLLADMPLVTPAIIDHLIEVFEETGQIVIPECQGGMYHPRILPANILPEFLQLKDSEKGTKVLEEHKEKIVRVTTGNRIDYTDIDHVDDLESITVLLKDRADHGRSLL